MKNHSILIVEDELPLVQALTTKLQRAGFNVLVAKNGEEGLSLAKSHHPDLLLVDLLMPRMDGMTMIRKLREDKWGAAARIIILTNLSDTAKAEEAEKFGVHEYLVKTDWKLEEVVRKIKEALA
ncbi:MAG: response regulator [Parcubacteria group bacterium]